MMRCVLYVPHRGEPKMVGKTFPVASTQVFYHETTSDQYHRKTDCPAGVDVCTLRPLSLWGAREAHVWVKDLEELLIAPLADIRDCGILERSDGRVRLHLPMTGWRPSRRTYKVPWITQKWYAPEVEPPDW